ncbi:MAG: ribonuclease E/G [Kineosporiaceae bacterium]|nr:ribonuclease E/G [Kineosporiaceae bacterium]
MTLDNEQAPSTTTSTTSTTTPRRRRAASRPAGPPAPVVPDTPADSPTGPSIDGAAVEAPVAEASAAEGSAGEVPPAPKRRTRKKAVAAPAVAAAETPTEPVAEPVAEPEAAPAAAPKRRTRKKAVAAPPAEATEPPVETSAESAAAQPARLAVAESAVLDEDETLESAAALDAPTSLSMPLFQAPAPLPATTGGRRRAASRPAGPPVVELVADEPVPAVAEPAAPAPADDEAEDDEAGRPRRRRRGGRGRRPRGREDGDAEETTTGEAADGENAGESGAAAESAESAESAEDGDDEDEDTPAGTRRRRRRRRRSGGGGEAGTDDDPPNTVVRVREGRRGSSGGSGSGDVTGLRGSTRLEAKKQRRREGREAGRRRPVITEAEFLARRESVDRVMLVRELEGRTQIGVLEDGVLVEHYVARRTQTSMVGNVYLGRVQNVLPSMEAAFIDVGKGRNAVLYAGEVNWDAAGLDGQAKRIEHALKSGESVLVQVTKDTIGHKGARLTSQISLPGRYLVYVPNGSMTGISRKLPDTERARLKKILRDVVPEEAGVIVRTAAEGASEDELRRDVARLAAQWEDIAAKAKAVNAPNLLYGEPDLAIRVVRDIFNEDFSSLLVSGPDTWDTLRGYIGHVAPDLVERMHKWDADEVVDGSARGDIFAAHRVDEQLAKALDRKVWLPSGGSLVIDRTEAMTVVDVNTGKFTGAGGNLEETVTKNNIEAAEEIVRQLRLRDIGGIIVVDFIDMVLESNRELVLRRLLECLGRDRTKHQVAEVTSLGLVQMTRKRVGQGLLEVFSETCEHCGGRGLIMHDEPVEKRQQDGGGASGGNSSGGNGSGGSGSGGSGRSGRSRGRSRGQGGNSGQAAPVEAAAG